MFKSRTLTMPEKYYLGIDDMLLYNWLKCLEGKLNYARINPVSTDEITQNDLNAWNKIYDNYLDTYGLNDLAKRFIKLQIKLSRTQNDYIIKESKFLFNVMRILKVEIEKLQKEMNKGVSTESVLVHLSKFMGFKQTPKTLTVKEYFDLLKEYERANKTV